MQEKHRQFLLGFADGFPKGAILASVAAMLFLLMILMCGCRTTRYVPMETVRTEYLRNDSALYTSIAKMLSDIERSKRSASDSLIHRIKESVTKNDAGDTTDYRLIEYVYMSSKEKAEYERAIREKDDSIGRLNTRLESVKADSISVPYPVERELSRWEKAKMDFGGIAVGAALAVIAWLVVWLVRVKRRK